MFHSFFVKYNENKNHFSVMPDSFEDIPSTFIPINIIEQGMNYVLIST